jgi:uncharacterized protein (TIGR02246 family)
MGLRICCILAALGLPLCAQTEGLPVLYQQALDTFLSAQNSYRSGHYQAADALLHSFWERHPVGAAEWEEHTDLARTMGLNFGSPPCYSALRMLTECVRWRLGAKTAKVRPSTVRLTVLLVGHSSGLEPGSWKELHGRGGTMAHRDLDTRVTAHGEQIVHESLWLFEEYVRAITGGKLVIETNIVRRPTLDVPVAVNDGPQSEIIGAGIGGSGMASVWPGAEMNKTDWWWIIYPSNVPERYPDFAEHEFVTGGMDLGPDGVSPAFVIDDLWLIRKPAPFAGRRTYSLEERWAYLPQWFQHEFFHQLYRSYPELGLEARDHQWFDRRTWPADFEGRFESDYYAESLHKRLQTADPPLDVELRYAAGEPAAKGSQAIQKLVNDFAAARNAHDAKAMAELYEEDAALVPMGGEAIKGREAIQKFWVPQLSGQATRSVQSIRFIRPTEAFARIDVHVDGDFRLMDSWVVRKITGRWRISVHRSFQR